MALALTGCADRDPPEEKSVTTAPAPLPVEIFTVSAASQTQQLQLPGTVQYRRETVLGFTTAGQVASVRFDEGDVVQKGTALASLDRSAVGASLESARAERDRAEAEYARLQKLFDQGWITRSRLEAAEATARAARAAISATSFSSNTATIVAPASGMILDRNIEQGQTVAAGFAAFRIGESGQGFVLNVPMTDRDAAKMRIGMVADVTVNALGDAPVAARIVEMDRRADPTTGSFEVRFQLPPRPGLSAGQLGTMSLTMARDAGDRVTVPASAIFGLREGEALVYVVDGANTVSRRNVLVGEMSDGGLEVTEGLNSGERIVAAGLERLRTGDRVKPVGQQR
ncbi:MAG: efflux RND transporter periplasmic adaptor subunit [Parasphingorhabdus sp.]|nr:efflux RND transporter periplasmic adaptor subunit [Parasphingorhabdus sp.]